MPNPEWGTKRICPTTGKRFYDLNKTPIISPYSGEIVDIETARRKAASVVIARPLPEKDEDVLVDDLEAEDDILEPGVADDADLDDDLLEDDADDTVSLDDLADVGGADGVRHNLSHAVTSFSGSLRRRPTPRPPRSSDYRARRQRPTFLLLAQ
jgi:uncharacterized protein (TIGR02300 family)